jgi:hypothetical protein
MKPTQWKLERSGEPFGLFGSPSGRTFKPGDVLRIPPPAGAGRAWLVVAVHPDPEPGFDGRLELVPAEDRDVGERRPPNDVLL